LPQYRPQAEEAKAVADALPEDSDAGDALLELQEAEEEDQEVRKNLISKIN